MKLAASNIGWSKQDDERIYGLMESLGFTGLEIAPTRFFPDDPYSHNMEIKEISRRLFEERGLVICSMQSIWYGRGEKVFGTAQERGALVEYTKRAMDFAVAAGCNNLVFGCPKNRAIPEGMSCDEAGHISRDFFGALGEYANSVGTVLSLEANPPIYNTNFINTTPEALSYVREMDMPGLRVNLDTGTMVENNEPADTIKGSDIPFINHVHLSEPALKSLSKRSLHSELMDIFAVGYDGFFSIEIGNQNPVSELMDNLRYVKQLCHG